MSGVNPASSNTSATGGYILDRPPGPITAAQLESVIQREVSTLANLPGSLTRPRWQPRPPTQPPPEVTWCSVGVRSIAADEFPEIRHDGSVTLEGAPGPGIDIMIRHSTVTALVTFYGPEADDAAMQLRDNLYHPQQMEASKPLKPLTVRNLARMPELVNQQWINRVDIEIDFRMQSERIYPVLNLNGADIVVRTEDGVRNRVEVRP